MNARIAKKVLSPAMYDYSPQLIYGSGRVRRAGQRMRRAGQKWAPASERMWCTAQVALEWAWDNELDAADYLLRDPDDVVCVRGRMLIS